MPIYEYRCTVCGGTEEAMQKISDAPLTKCSHCGKDALQKNISAAGFQLAGSGWYASGYQNKAPTAENAPANKTEAKAEAKTDAASPTSSTPKTTE